MATRQMGEVIWHLCRDVLLQDTAGRTDGQLLEDYISRRDEAALAALVHRHGPMVWGVCRRVLGNHHDAEDAFQATFLVFVRKVASIASRELLANWLYGVAHLTARKARATAAKRRTRERQVTEIPEPTQEQDLWNDLQPLLDQELSRLPDKYRAVIVLCDLEGKTRKEAAQLLGVPEGTVASRLATARAMLAKRLTRQGMPVSSGALAMSLSQNAASASVAASVVSSTIKAAGLISVGQAAAGGLISARTAALTEGVLKTMLLSKLKVATALVLLVVMVCLAAGGFVYRAQAEAPKSAGPTPPVLRQAEAPKSDRPAAPMSDKETQPSLTQEEKSKSDKELPSKTCREMLLTYAQNEARGEEEFLGKKLRVTGKVRRVDRVAIKKASHYFDLQETANQYFVVTLGADEPKDAKKSHGGFYNPENDPVVFVFPSSGRKDLAELETGQQVTIEGICEGRKEQVQFYITFTACKIVKSK